ncbi:MAG: NAD(P)/FAD-dependent oxidoreductase [Actinomycetota bacterium]|nr:NAD(P)/FAD-dependent oxidoreductase [Actinomycetota bacterium]
MKTYDLAIIGSGPSGLMAALTAARKGISVVLFEKNEIIGRKILATGNGRCNLTNKNISVMRYHGACRKFIRSILNKFDQFQTIKFFESLGVILKEEDRGRVFPRSNQASTIVNALKHAIKESGVNTVTGLKIKSVEKSTEFIIKNENNQTFKAKKVILATGGKAAFQFGSSGDGFFWASKFGHNIVPVFAALVPVETREIWVKEVSGIKMETKITTKAGNKTIHESYGDCLFTDYGLSGTAIMTQAGKIGPLLDNNSVKIFVDLYPEITKQDLIKKITYIFKNSGSKTLVNSLAGFFPLKLAPVILHLSDICHDKKASETSETERLKIVRCIKAMKLTVKKLRPLKEAQISTGGIDTEEVDRNTLESKIIKGLYFAGEIMDVDGDSGGFNLQWAWSSGFVSGQGISLF